MIYLVIYLFIYLLLCLFNYCIYLSLFIWFKKMRKYADSNKNTIDPLYNSFTRSQ